VRLVPRLVECSVLSREKTRYQIEYLFPTTSRLLWCTHLYTLKQFLVIQTGQHWVNNSLQYEIVNQDAVSMLITTERSDDIPADTENQCHVPSLTEK
jgi:hypothetical protein